MGIENRLITKNVRKMQVYMCFKKTFFHILPAKYLNLLKSFFCHNLQALIRSFSNSFNSTPLNSSEFCRAKSFFEDHTT